MILAACALGLSQQTTPNLGGAWTLTAVSSHRGINFVGTLSVTQVGTSISGQILYNGFPCVASGKDGFVGSVVPSVSMLVSTSSEKLTFSGGVVTAGQITNGTYTSKYVADAERCNPLSGDGDSGTWSAKQLLPGPSINLGVSCLWTAQPQ